MAPDRGWPSTMVKGIGKSVELTIAVTQIMMVKNAGIMADYSCWFQLPLQFPLVPEHEEMTS